MAELQSSSVGLVCNEGFVMDVIARERPAIPLPMPWGWFHVLYSHELEVGESKPLFYFEQELVAFRTESGVAKVVDAYCPHMGAHLGYGIHENTERLSGNWGKYCLSVSRLAIQWRGPVYTYPLCQKYAAESSQG